jgi:hypothetical protein
MTDGSCQPVIPAKPEQRGCARNLGNGGFPHAVRIKKRLPWIFLAGIDAATPKYDGDERSQKYVARNRNPRMTEIYRLKI